MISEKDFFAIAGYIQTGIVLQVDYTGAKINQSNVILCGKDNAKADYICDFLQMNVWDETGKSIKFDTIIIAHNLRYFDNVVENIYKAYTLLKPGGHLIIIESQEKDDKAKHFWLIQEFEGFLSLWDTKFFIEHKFFIDEKNYCFILKKQGESYA